MQYSNSDRAKPNSTIVEQGIPEDMKLPTKKISRGVLSNLGVGLLTLASFIGCSHNIENTSTPTSNTSSSQENDLQIDIRGSLPQLTGEANLDILNAEVSITRDKYGVPHIAANSYLDGIRAEGYLHAQERFFQMDLLRRTTSGRLAEILGPSALQSDKFFRSFQFKQVAQAVVANFSANERKLFEAYAAGVNSGLENLRSPAPEYQLLGLSPEPWTEVDSVLVFLYMFYDLNNTARSELMAEVMAAELPEELYKFLLPQTTRFDSLVGGVESDYRAAEIPSEEVLNLRTGNNEQANANAIDAPTAINGSNNWAVAGKHTHDGRALVANDPHLGLRMPGIWYRTELSWPACGKRRCVSGVSLPGSPGVIIGSNGDIAWGFTNLSGDFQDHVKIELNPNNPNQYKTPEGFEAFETVNEEIKVRGAANHTLTLQKTRWGNLIGRSHNGQPLALRWTALDADKINLKVLELGQTNTLAKAEEIARAWYGPAQNIVIADKHGNISWMVTGYLPKRKGFDGSKPTSWADGTRGWEEALPEELRPHLRNPDSGFLHTANNRTVKLNHAQNLGGQWGIATRANRIAERLAALESGEVTETDLFNIQLDTRMRVLDFYKSLILELTEDTTDGNLLRVRELVSNWNGNADTDQPGMRILEHFRHKVHSAVLNPLLQDCLSADPNFRYRWSQSEEVVRRILEEKPEHLLDPTTDSWNALLNRALLASVRSLESGELNLDSTWGEEHKTHIQHPLTAALGDLARAFNLPAEALPGHGLAVRAARPSHGASMRMVVSPGKENEGILHMPGGQSGHPWSPYYRNSHEAWIKGEAQAFNKGETVWEFKLKP